MDIDQRMFQSNLLKNTLSHQIIEISVFLCVLSQEVKSERKVIAKQTEPEIKAFRLHIIK